jgi:hypothetical protein
MAGNVCNRQITAASGKNACFHGLPYGQQQDQRFDLSNLQPLKTSCSSEHCSLTQSNAVGRDIFYLLPLAQMLAQESHPIAKLVAIYELPICFFTSSNFRLFCYWFLKFRFGHVKIIKLFLVFGKFNLGFPESFDLTAFLTQQMNVLNVLLYEKHTLFLSTK